jgi:hydrogenase maturation protease
VVLGVLDMLGAEPGRILVVACEPLSAEPGMSLSAPVEAAVGEAVALVTRLVADSVRGRPPGPPDAGLRLAGNE